MVIYWCLRRQPSLLLLLILTVKDLNKSVIISLKLWWMICTIYAIRTWMIPQIMQLVEERTCGFCLIWSHILTLKVPILNKSMFFFCCCFFWNKYKVSKYNCLSFWKSSKHTKTSGGYNQKKNSTVCRLRIWGWVILTWANKNT